MMMITSCALTSFGHSVQSKFAEPNIFLFPLFWCHMALERAERVLRENSRADEVSLEGYGLTTIAPLLPLFAHMPRLVCLKVRHNAITFLPDDLTALQHLHTLDLTGNPIAGLGSVLGGLQCLGCLKHLRIDLPFEKEEEDVIEMLTSLESFNGTSLTEDDSGTGNDVGEPVVLLAGTQAESIPQQEHDGTAAEAWASQVKNPLLLPPTTSSGLSTSDELIGDTTPPGHNVVYVHGADGGFDLGQHNQSGYESGVSSLCMMFLGDARRVRDVYWDDVKDCVRPGLRNTVLAVLDIALRAFGEVVFLDNTWSSLLLLVCLLIQDWFSTLMVCLFLLVLSTFTILWPAFPRQAVSKSLYLYNTVLVTIAMCIFAHESGTLVPISGINFLSVCVGNSINFLIVCFFRMSDTLAPYCATFPFNIASIAFLIASNGVSFRTLRFSGGSVLREAPLVQIITPITSAANLTKAEAILMAVPNGFGQVFFVDTWPLGLIMLLSCGIHRPTLCAFATIGSLSGALFAWAFDADMDAIATGLWGFNPVLLAMLVGLTWSQGAGQHWVAWNVQRFMVAVALCLITVFVTAIERFIFTNKLGVSAFIMPFCTVGMLYISILASPIFKATAVVTPSDRTASQREANGSRPTSSKENRRHHRAATTPHRVGSMRRSDSVDALEMKPSPSTSRTALLRFRSQRQRARQNRTHE